MGCAAVESGRWRGEKPLTGAHVSGNMLGPGKRGLAYRALRGEVSSLWGTTSRTAGTGDRPCGRRPWCRELMGSEGCWWKKAGSCTSPVRPAQSLSHINHPCDSDVILPMRAARLISESLLPPFCHPLRLACAVACSHTLLHVTHALRCDSRGGRTQRTGLERADVVESATSFA